MDTAVGLASAVRGREVTARSVTEDALRRIELSQPVTNAWHLIRGEEALADADAIDAHPRLADLPLAGVPVAVKNNVTLDHEVVRRLRAAGAVVVGLTRVPQLCIWGATDSADGITRNPWDLQRTPGGSSGGAAAAVASGDVPIAHGNDGMGSIRIPAACCGLLGIKPGAGVIPAELGANSWNGMAENGPLATTVADLALMFSVLSDDPADATLVEPQDVHVAWSTKSPAPGISVSAEWANAAQSTAILLREAGHRITAASPPYPVTMMPRLALPLWTTGAAQDAALEAEELEPRNRRHVAIGRWLLTIGYDAHGAREQWRRAAERFFGDVDVLLTPTLARSPVRAIAWAQRGWTANLIANLRYAPFAAPWNLIGWPAMSVPAGVDAQGRPLAVQLVGRPGSESLLMGLAAQIEARHPWQRTVPLPPAPA